MSSGRSRRPQAALRIDADLRPSSFRPGTDGQVPSRSFRAPSRIDDVMLGPEHTGEAPIELVAPRTVQPPPRRPARQAGAKAARTADARPKEVDAEQEARREADRQLIIDAIASGRAKKAAKQAAAASSADVSTEDDAVVADREAAVAGSEQKAAAEKRAADEKKAKKKAADEKKAAAAQRAAAEKAAAEKRAAAAKKAAEKRAAAAKKAAEKAAAQKPEVGKAAAAHDTRPAKDVERDRILEMIRQRANEDVRTPGRRAETTRADATAGREARDLPPATPQGTSSETRDLLVGLAIIALGLWAAYRLVRWLFF
jgi:hypothetical protein